LEQERPRTVSRPADVRTGSDQAMSERFTDFLSGHIAPDLMGVADPGHVTSSCARLTGVDSTVSRPERTIILGVVVSLSVARRHVTFAVYPCWVMVKRPGNSRGVLLRSGTVTRTGIVADPAAFRRLSIGSITTGMIPAVVDINDI